MLRAAPAAVPVEPRSEPRSRRLLARVRLPGRAAWLTLAACVAATLPVVVSTIRAMIDGFVPNGDRGVIAIRAYDVLTSSTPLVGQFSASSLLTGRTTHSPGPLLYWLLAPAAHIGGMATLALTMGVVDAAALAGCVLIARRRGGAGLMIVVAAALALMCRSLPAEIYHDIWNPSVGIVPLTLLMFVTWSLGCGERRMLPLAVLLASFAAQAELTFVLPSVALLAIGAIGLLAPRLTRGGRAAGTREWRWWVAALAVAAVCWAPPVIDQLTGHPGNFSLIARTASARRHTVGLGIGWHAVVRSLGVPPWWLRAPPNPFYMLADVRAAPEAGSAVTAVLALVALVAAGATGMWRRRADVASAAAIGLVLAVALAAVAAETPTRPILMSSLGYTLWWGAPAGMFAWLALGSAAASLPRPALGRVARYAVAPGALAAVALGAAVAAGGSPDQDRVEYRPLRTAITRVDAAVPAKLGTVKVSGGGSWTSFDFQAAIAYALRRRGLRPVATWAARRIGPRYSIGHRFGAAVFAWDGHPPRTSDRVLARIPLASARDGVVTITLAGP